MRTLWQAVVLLSLVLSGASAGAVEITRDAVNAATFDERKSPREGRLSALAVKLQVQLDRAHFSPGEIDGKFGENLQKALRAFAEANGLASSKALTAEIWSKLQEMQPAEPVIADYAITEQDVKGPFLARLPTTLEDLKPLPRLSFVSAREGLAEKFHMSQQLLLMLNPGKAFDRAGEIIAVVGFDAKAKPPAAARLEVDKTRETVKAFAEDGRMVAFFPATVGSVEKPTPSGTLKITSVHLNPAYRYDPEYRFKGV
jgi:peptidoglycan hydrolase-like protein with peptidoglycan-binding domain